MRPLNRSHLNKRKSAKRFNKATRHTKSANSPLRGGYRF